jgi:hypothetical protein
MEHKQEEVQVNLANFQVRVDTVIFSVDMEKNKLLVLLRDKQKSPSEEQLWGLPTTLVYQEESLESSARRTLAEQITVHHLYLEQLYTFGDVNNSWLITDMRDLSISYFALVRYEEAQITNDIKRTCWFTLDELPSLSFNDDRIIEYGYRRLKSKLEYSPIAFKVLPKLFTLSDLYQLYTSVLGENFTDYSNFRSRLLKLGFLIDTSQKACKGAGRPATLYKFDANAFAPLKDKPFVFI